MLTVKMMPVRAKCSLCNRNPVDVDAIWPTDAPKPYGACNDCLEILRMYEVLTAPGEDLKLGDDGRIHTRLMDNVKGDKIQYLLWWQTIASDGRVVFSASVVGAFTVWVWLMVLTFMVLR